MDSTMEATLTAPCEVCEKALLPYEARLFVPGHGVQAHVTCGETQRTFYQPVHSEAGPEAIYWEKGQAEEAVKAYQQPENADDFAEGEWSIREVLMAPAAYYQLNEFDGY